MHEWNFSFIWVKWPDHVQSFMFRLLFSSVPPFFTRSTVTHFYDRNHLVAYGVFINHRHMPDLNAICSIFHANKRFDEINAMIHLTNDARRSRILFFFSEWGTRSHFFHPNDILIAIGKIPINRSRLNTILHSTELNNIRINRVTFYSSSGQVPAQRKRPIKILHSLAALMTNSCWKSANRKT